MHANSLLYFRFCEQPIPKIGNFLSTFPNRVDTCNTLKNYHSTDAYPIFVKKSGKEVTQGFYPFNNYDTYENINYDNLSDNKKYKACWW